MLQVSPIFSTTPFKIDSRTVRRRCELSVLTERRRRRGPGPKDRPSMSRCKKPASSAVLNNLCTVGLGNPSASTKSAGVTGTPARETSSNSSSSRRFVGICPFSCAILIGINSPYLFGNSHSANSGVSATRTQIEINAIR